MKQKPYHIHFVCRGNTYRSRLAAAYMASIASDRFTVSSSGVDTYLAPIKTSEQYTQHIARKHHLSFEINKIKTQSNNELFSQADIIVFIKKDIYDIALKSYSFDARKSIVWQVKDINDAVKEQALREHNEAALDAIAEQTFQVIQKHCDELMQYISKTSWVDIVDADNRPTDIRLPINWATDRGLWHRGIHVVVRTTDGKYVVGKRTPTIVFAPSMLELTLGGGVDSGEYPLQAAIRETHEELGVRLPVNSFKPLFVHKHNSYHPHYKKYSRNYTYVYLATVPLLSSQLHPQPGEVAELRLLSKDQVKYLISAHRMRNFGKMKPSYQIYNRAIKAGALPR